jgi:ATP phosphoribosyltransferase
VRDGAADAGITGLDFLLETGEADDERAQVVFDNIGIGRAKVVLAVPDGWVDVWSVADLADLATRQRERGRDVRVATSYPNVTRAYLHRHGIHSFNLLVTEGGLEAAPSLGLADIISTVLETGTTLLANRLKMIRGGTILRTATVCIANMRALKQSQVKLAAIKEILERFEARRRAQQFYALTANMRGDSPDAIARHIWVRPWLAGIQGPTIAKVYGPPSDNGDWYAATVVVPTERLTEAVQHLRDSGGSGITAVPASYVFEEQSQSYSALQARLSRSDNAERSREL